jgi:tyrosyl-tRNA synthetase
MQVDDADVDRFLRQLTLMEIDDIVAVMAEHTAEPHRRHGQRALATAFTQLVHGPEAASAAATATELLFGGDPTTGDESVFAVLASEVATTPLGGDLPTLVDLLAGSVVTSKSEARRLLDQRGVSVNGTKQGEDRAVAAGDFLHDRWLLLRKGKSTYHLIERTSA